MLSRLSLSRVSLSSLVLKNNTSRITNIIRYHGSDSHDDFKVQS